MRSPMTSLISGRNMLIRGGVSAKSCQLWNMALSYIVKTWDTNFFAHAGHTLSSKHHNLVGNKDKKNLNYFCLGFADSLWREMEASTPHAFNAILKVLFHPYLLINHSVDESLPCQRADAKMSANSFATAHLHTEKNELFLSLEKFLLDITR